jgi:hypothetical protein
LTRDGFFGFGVQAFFGSRGWNGCGRWGVRRNGGVGIRLKPDVKLAPKGGPAEDDQDNQNFLVLAGPVNMAIHDLPVAGSVWPCRKIRFDLSAFDFL